MGGRHCASQSLLALVLHLHLKTLSGKLYFIGLAAIFIWFCDAPGKDLIRLASDQQAEASAQAELAFGISGQGCDSTPVDLISPTIDSDLTLRTLLARLDTVGMVMYSGTIGHFLYLFTISVSSGWQHYNIHTSPDSNTFLTLLLHHSNASYGTLNCRS